MRVRNRGFSLIEVLMAMVVLAVAFLALIQIFPSAYLTVYRSKDQLVAVQLAQCFMDETRAGPYALMAASAQYDIPVESVMNDVTTSVTYHVVVDVSPVSPAGSTLPNSDLARIRVSVQWPQKSASGFVLLRSVRAESSRLRDS